MSSMLTLAGNAAPTGFYDFPIEQSLRFEDGDSAYLSRTPASAGNRKTWTLSMWFKRANLGGGKEIFCAYIDNNNRIIMRNNGDTFEFQQQNGGTQYSLVPSMQFRDVSAWYHLVYSCDTTQATAANRVKIYINGEQITSFSTEQYPAQNQDSAVNSTGNHYLGNGEYNSAVYSNYFDGYMADVNLIDGQALDPTSFGETKSGIWIPKNTAGLTFGTNGFRLAFADGAAIGDDTSGNTNDFTANNLVVSDVVLDSPTNNFAVLNNLETNDSGSTYTEGNLVFQTQSAGSNVGVASFSIPKSSKWYWEVNVLSTSGTIGDNARIGLQVGNNITPSLDVRYKSNGDKSVNNASSAYGASYAAGDIIGVAVDADSNTVEFYKNGSSQGSISYTMDADSDYFPVLPEASGTINIKFAINFGQDSTFAGNEAAGGNADENGYGDFAYAPPSGYLSLCSANLPTGAIDTLADETPEDYFSALTYSGTGATNSLTGVGFQPSLTWIKQRTQAYSHALYDAVRGVQKELQSNTTNAETTETQGLTSFDSDGFTVGTRTNLNQSSTNLVAWNWKANNAGVSNTDGSITSTVSVGATSQQNWFSIVGYQGNGTAGATVGHGLNVTPDLLIIRRRSPAEAWPVWVGGAGFSATEYMRLNASTGKETATTLFNSILPSSSVVTLGNGNFVNTNASDYIMYAFANAEGLCKVGSYTGNGSADGVFVNVGFRPSWILLKRTDAATDWILQDNRRLGYNVDNNDLVPNQSYAEATDDRLDQLSNGFKLRSTFGTTNASGGNYIYIAIAEQPFKYANAR